jgi:hypothetical protein
MDGGSACLSQWPHPGQSRARRGPSPLPQPLDLRDGDQLQSSVQSKAIFILNSRDEFELPAGALVQFQLWNSRDANSAVYLTSIVGQLNLRQPGVQGKSYVVKDGRLYLPGQKPQQKPMALTVLKAAPLDLQLNEKPKVDGVRPVEDFENDNLSTPEDASSRVEPHTLSNEMIDETIVENQGHLQKCWLSRLKDAPNLKGQLVIQFEITKRGKVKDARVAETTLEDETLQKCVLAVMERISFRSYNGSEISLSYPIKFE